jgi:hypothetical protein
VHDHQLEEVFLLGRLLKENETKRFLKELNANRMFNCSCRSTIQTS